MAVNMWLSIDELGVYADSEYAEEAIQTASNLLWIMSGRKFSGPVEVTEVYPAIQRKSIDSTSHVINPSNTNIFINRLEETRTGTKLRLNGRPVMEIKEIKAGNAVISPSDYYLTNRSVINFRNGIRKDLTVTYKYGSKPPVSGKMAARALSMEFVKLWSGDEDCDLPTRVTSISRQGISFTILDNQDFIADLRTGVYAVDLFLKSVNPDGARAKSKVFSPDIRRGRRVATGTDSTFDGGGPGTTDHDEILDGGGI